VAEAPSGDGANGAAAAVASEPWIDTPLCTSCNDCTAINAHLFIYDSNKQAMMGDLSSGTFAQVVQAAEKCPARCIHPGEPWDPSENGVEDLIRRAAPFQ
jgi:ferredoxin